MTDFPWQGLRQCLHPQCLDFEIEGLGFCLRHVGKDDLAEAEAITGWRRCTWRTGRCHEIATVGSQPPYCPMHQNMQHEAQQRRASTGFVNQAEAEQLAQIMTEHGHRLINPPPIGDPLEALLRLADQVVELCAVMRDKAAELEMNKWRYAHDRAGEQIRTEIFLYERALDRAAKILINIAKLRIAEHKLELEREMATVIQRAFGLALEDSGADLVGQEKARQRLARELEPYLQGR